MASRLPSNLAIAIAGVILLGASLSLGPAVSGWVGVGMGVFELIALLVAFAFRGRGAAQRAIDLIMSVLAVWTIVAARVFSGVALKWLMFSAGVVAGGLAVVAMVVHEVLMHVSLHRARTRAQQLEMALAQTRRVSSVHAPDPLTGLASAHPLAGHASASRQ